MFLVYDFAGPIKCFCFFSGDVELSEKLLVRGISLLAFITNFSDEALTAYTEEVFDGELSVTD